MDQFPLLPIRGATNGTSFKGTPPDMAPYQAIRNFRAFGTRTDRPRGGKRPGLKKTFTRRLKNAAVQAVASISRATGQDGYTLGTCNPLTTVISTPSAALYGQVGALDDVPSMDWFYYLDVTGLGGSATNTVSACAWDPDGEFLAIASNFTATDGKIRVACLNATGQLVWASTYAESGFDVYCNALCVTKLFTFMAIATTQNQGVQLVAFRNDTGAVAFVNNIEGWSSEAVALCRYTDASAVEFLFVAFSGVTQAGTYTGGIGGGTIAAGRWARDFRSGIVKYQVDAVYGSVVLTKVPFGTGTPSTGAYYEAAHGYWRYSEQVPGKPHGCIFTAITAGADGSIYFTKRNQGWGPNNVRAEFRPDGLYEPYATVGKISPAGVIQWLRDTDSIREADDLGYFNDYLGNPSLQCVAVDADGNVFAAGRQTAAGSSVFALTTLGVPAWDANLVGLTGTIREGAASFDASDNTIVFAGDRNTLWDGSGGTPAFMWKLTRLGEMVWSWDMNESVSGLCVAASGSGKLYFGGDCVT